MASKLLVLLALIFFGLSTAACEKEGGAKKAGKKIDNAFESAKEKIDEATK